MTLSQMFTAGGRRLGGGRRWGGNAHGGYASHRQSRCMQLDSGNCVLLSTAMWLDRLWLCLVSGSKVAEYFREVLGAWG